LRSAKARSTSGGFLGGIDRGQVLLLGLDNVVALAGEVNGTLEEAKHAIVTSPAVTAWP
jgi:hypothetical protein